MTDLQMLIERVVDEVLNEALRGTRLRKALAKIYANKEPFNLDTFHELPREVRKYYLKTRKDTRSLGEGSSRYVYKIGPDLALKVAKGEKGKAQNRAEVDAELCGDVKVFAQVYEYSDDYSWITSELAKPIKKKQLEKLLGISMKDLFWALHSLENPEEVDEGDIVKIKELKKDPWFKKLIKMIQACDLEPADVAKTDSWGLRNDGSPILIDYGLGVSVYDTYYSNE